MVRCFRFLPLVLLLVGGKALAQSPENTPAPAPAQPDQPAVHTIDFGDQGVHPTPPAQPPPPSAPVPAPQAEPPGQMDADGNYTVKHGDTLWDLSQQFLNNPWYWPKIWADNPVVENPHWIYPGNRLKIRHNGAGVPGEVGPAGEAGAGPGAAPTSDEAPSTGYDAARAVQESKELADFSTGTINGPAEFAQDSDLVTMGGSIPFNLSAVPSVMRARVTSLVTQRELAEAGTITHSFAQKEMLVQYDKVYMHFPNLNEVKVGQVYSVFRKGEAVTHPVTKQKFGYQTHIVGSVTITGKNSNEAVGEVGPGVEDMERGDRLALNANVDKSIEVTPNEVDVSGILLTTDVDGLSIPSQNQAVFVDKGAKDGVKVGNTFTVIETGDGLNRLLMKGELDTKDKDVQEPVATLVVYNVSDHACATLIVKSLRELNLGDRAEMRRARNLSAGSGGDLR